MNKNYISRLNTIFKIATSNNFDIEQQEFNINLLNTPQSIFIKLEHANIKNKKQYITAIISYLKLFNNTQNLIRDYKTLTKNYFVI